MNDARRPPLWTWALLVVVAAGVHLTTLDAPFFFDDLNSIEHNPNVRQLWPLTVSMSAPDEATVAGRPLVALSLAVNHALGGLDPRGYHLFNVLCHVLATLAVFQLARVTLRSPRLGASVRARADGLALSMALLWSIHPLQTEAVTYVVQRTELMMALFLLGTLLAVQRGLLRSERRDSWYALAIVLCLCGMGCKEVMVVAPVVVLLYDRAFHARSYKHALLRSGWLYLGLLMSWLLLGALLLESPRDRSVGTDLGIGAFDYLLTQAQVLVHYLRLSVWPSPLTVSYHWPVVTAAAAVLVEGTLVLALLGGTLWCLARRPVLGFCGAVFFVVLAPTSSVLPIVTEVAAERRMYLPLLPLVALAVVGGWRFIERFVPRERRRVVAAGSVVVVALAAIGGSVQRLRDYDSALSIWSDAVVKQPDNPIALFNLAWNLNQAGQSEEAVSLYARSYELQPRYVPNLTSFATCLQQLGQLDAAIERHHEVLALEPDNTQSLHNLGLCYARQGQLAAAEHCFRQALSVQPDDPDVHSNLAVVLLHAGSPGGESEVSRHVAEALRLAPEHPQATALLGELRATPAR